jgi:hypothetical protein
MVPAETYTLLYFKSNRIYHYVEPCEGVITLHLSTHPAINDERYGHFWSPVQKPPEWNPRIWSQPLFIAVIVLVAMWQVTLYATFPEWELNVP